MTVRGLAFFAVGVLIAQSVWAAEVIVKRWRDGARLRTGLLWGKRERPVLTGPWTVASAVETFSAEEAVRVAQGNAAGPVPDLMVGGRLDRWMYYGNHIAEGRNGPGYQGTSDLIIVDNLEEANLLSSEVGAGAIHSPVLDIDYPAQLIPSTTPGHFHLYLDGLTMDWETYAELLTAMAKAGMIEDGYAAAAIARKFTGVRKPGVLKLTDMQIQNRMSLDAMGASGLDEVGSEDLARPATLAPEPPPEPPMRIAPDPWADQTIPERQSIPDLQPGHNHTAEVGCNRWCSAFTAPQAPRPAEWATTRNARGGVERIEVSEEYGLPSSPDLAQDLDNHGMIEVSDPRPGLRSFVALPTREPEWAECRVGCRLCAIPNFTP